MQIRLLGPVEVEAGGRLLELGGPKQRAVLALLALNAGRTVSVDRLVDGLWSEPQQPASAAKMVQLYVSQLRKLLADFDGCEIVTRGRGYELRVDADAVDAALLERLVAEASSGGDGRAAESALALWRGSALSDLLDEPFAPSEARRLEELHLAVLELAVESDLRAGRHREVIGRLETLLAEHPLSERLHTLRLLALYRAGRQADALEAYRAARRALVDEIGVEPGPDLRRMHEAILRQDPELDLVVPDAGWARRRTAERVEQGAGIAEARRSELREAETELASDVADLDRLRERPALAGGVEQAGATAVCPFKGLAPFDVADAEYYFGRERLVAEIVARLVGAGLLAVVGPSGSGKSSAVRAGLLPALARGMLPGSERWDRSVMRPGEHPLRTLERKLDGYNGEARLVLVVDQFEETFTVCEDGAERARFIDALVDLARGGERPVTVVIVLRADYYGACSAHPRLARLLGQSQVVVGPMQDRELALAITGPAARAGLAVEPRLVERLVGDVTGETGALPLLSTSLLELWQERDGVTLTLAAYERSGGVRGAVARLAERAYTALSEDDRGAARRILLRLSSPGDGDSAVRRRVALEELDVEHDQQAARVVGLLADSRLITLGEDSAEVSHEALLREWPRLRGWLEEDAEGRRLHTHISRAARDWDEADHDAGQLLRGARLASALEWAPRHEGELNHLEREFLDASRSASELEAERDRRANRRLRTLLALAAAGLAIAVAAGLVALSQRGDARDAARAADAQRLGAQALTVDRIDDALLLARAGVALDESPATRGNLLSVLMRSPALIGTIRGDGWPLYTVAVSPDERLVATGNELGTVSVFDRATRQPVSRPYQLRDGLVQNVAFSPDGETLAVAGHEPQDLPPGALVDLIDPRTGERRKRFVLPRFPERVDFVVAHVGFLPGGRELIVQQSPCCSPEREAPAAVLWRLDSETGKTKGPPLRVGQHRSFGLTVTGDRRRVFVTSPGDDATFEIDPLRMRVVRRYPHGDSNGAVSADGRLYALGAEDGTVRLLDLRSGAVRRLSGRHESVVLRLAFTPDGRTLVTTSEDGGVLVWDLERGEVRERLEGHTRNAYGLSLSTSGATAYTAALDGRTIIWDLAGDRRLARPFTTGAPFVVPDDEFPKELAVTPDGRSLAVAESNGRVDFLSTRTLLRERTVKALRGFAAAVDISRDGRTLAVAGEDGQLVLIDAGTGRKLSELVGMRNPSQTVSFSPDGKLVAAGDLGRPAPGGGVSGGRVHLWDARQPAGSSGRPRLSFRLSAPSLSFSPDGRLLAAAGIEDPTEVREVPSGRVVARLRTSDFGRSVAFSPDGRLLATGLFDGRTQLWSTETWKPIGRALEGQTGRIISPEFSPDGRTLVTSSADGTVVLWDVATRKQLGAPLTVLANGFVSGVLAPDGRYVFAVSNQGPAMRWDVSPEAWKKHACDVAGREMTSREWRDALPARAQQPVCAEG